MATEPLRSVDLGEEAWGGVVIIRGITRNGRPFRPGDWAQRLALTASAGTCPTERPLCFHPHVRTGMDHGVPYVEVDRILQRVDPDLFAFLMAFASQQELECSEMSASARRGEHRCSGVHAS